MRARDIMSAPVTTVRQDTSIKEAAAVLAGNRFTALPVIDDEDRLVGVVTEADLMRDRVPSDPHAWCHPGEEPAAVVTIKVGEVMTSPVVAMGPGADVSVLAGALLDAGHLGMPIVDGSRVVGIVTRRDIVAVIARGDRVVVNDVRQRLEICGGGQRWQVDAHDGMVSIRDRFDDETDRHVATVLAESVPGVVRATALAAHEEDYR